MSVDIHRVITKHLMDIRVRQEIFADGKDSRYIPSCESRRRVILFIQEGYEVGRECWIK